MLLSAESTYPIVHLEASVTAVPALVVDSVEVISTKEIPGEAVFVTYRIGSREIEVQVLTESTYYSDWSDGDIEEAVRNHIADNFSAANG